MNNVFTHFSHDHERLDKIFEQFKASINSESLDEAKLLWGDFNQGLRAHISWEEDHLFPLFEQHTGAVDTGPTAVMRREHAAIEVLLSVLKENLDKRDVDLLGRCHELEALLKQHNIKEERVLYPAIDDLCSDVEIKTLLAELV